MKAMTATRKFEVSLSAGYVLPAVLAFNTVALFALDQAGAIPAWVKSAAALFLSF